MWAHQLKPQEYLHLMERGWRRSGKYCYKPILSRTCCPLYTIRCDADNFVLTKSQKKTLRRVNQFLRTGKVPGEPTPLSSRPSTGVTNASIKFEDVPSDASVIMKDQSELDAVSFKTIDTASSSTDTLSIRTEDTGMTSVSDISSRVTSAKSTGSNLENPISGKSESSELNMKKSPELSSVPQSKKMKYPVIPVLTEDGLMEKAKVIRIRRRIARVAQMKGCSVEEATNIVKNNHQQKVRHKVNQDTKSLEDYINLEKNSSYKHKLQVKLVSNSFVNQKDSAFESFEKNYLGKEHKVYEKYQMKIHGDDADECSKKQYQRFLVDSPLQLTPFRGQTVGMDGLKGFGSYHMQYWLDDSILVAVGVIDILQTGISSVYLFYDPEYAFLGLGSYSALREIHLTRLIRNSYLPFRFYYMGFYIHSCPKMRYKSRFQPSFLLCPEAKTWHPTKECVPLLDRNKYSRLNPSENKVDEDARGIQDEDIGIFIAGQGIANLSVYLSLKNTNETEDERDKSKSSKHNVLSIEEKVREYATLVGKKCVKSMLLYLE